MLFLVFGSQFSGLGLFELLVGLLEDGAWIEHVRGAERWRVVGWFELCRGLLLVARGAERVKVIVCGGSLVFMYKS
jgi:hypothetical protein